MTTYVYHGIVAATKITDSQILAVLPKSVPRALLVQAAASGALPGNLGASLGAVVPLLPDPVPLQYTFQDDSTFWVDPTTGLVILFVSIEPPMPTVMMAMDPSTPTFQPAVLRN